MFCAPVAKASRTHPVKAAASEDGDDGQGQVRQQVAHRAHLEGVTCARCDASAPRSGLGHTGPP